MRNPGARDNRFSEDRGDGGSYQCASLKLTRPAPGGQQKAENISFFYLFIFLMRGVTLGIQFNVPNETLVWGSLTDIKNIELINWLNFFYSITISRLIGYFQTNTWNTYEWKCIPFYCRFILIMVWILLYDKSNQNWLCNGKIATI